MRKSNYPERSHSCYNVRQGVNPRLICLVSEHRHSSSSGCWLECDEVWIIVWLAGCCLVGSVGQKTVTEEYLSSFLNFLASAARGVLRILSMVVWFCWAAVHKATLREFESDIYSKYPGQASKIIKMSPHKIHKMELRCWKVLQDDLVSWTQDSNCGLLERSKWTLFSERFLFIVFQ